MRVKGAGQRVKVARGRWACLRAATRPGVGGRKEKRRGSRQLKTGLGAGQAWAQSQGRWRKGWNGGASGEAGGSRRWRAVVRGLVVKKLPAWCPPIRLRRFVCAQFRPALASPSIASPHPRPLATEGVHGNNNNNCQLHIYMTAASRRGKLRHG